MKLVLSLFVVLFMWSVSFNVRATVFDIDFNTGLSNQSGGDLTYIGAAGFQVTFTDDNSGGNENGVHVTNLNYGNIKVGSSTDFVLGTFNMQGTSSVNAHTSGIVALFNYGVDAVSFFDSDDDSTLKSLFAYDEFGNLIYQSVAATRQTFSVDTSMTLGNVDIYAIEFDTQAGTAGGAADGTYFTIDDFHIEYSAVPEPSSLTLLFAGFIGLWGKNRKTR